MYGDGSESKDRDGNKRVGYALQVTASTREGVIFPSMSHKPYPNTVMGRSLLIPDSYAAEICTVLVAAVVTPPRDDITHWSDNLGVVWVAPSYGNLPLRKRLKHKYHQLYSAIATVVAQGTL